MSLDWHILMQHWAEILVFLLALVTIKAVLISIAARILGWSTPGSVQLGFSLAQGSELVFVIIAIPTLREALGEGTVGVMIMGIAASLAFTPALADLGNRLARVLRRRLDASLPGEHPSGAATAPAVLRFQRVDETRIQAWMQRQQERALQANVGTASSRATLATA